MRRLHAALLVVLAFGLALGGTAVAGGVDTDVGQETTVGGVDTGVASTTLECSYPVEVTDATGETVVVEEEPEEVVALGASDAQVLWELGVEERVTGLPLTPFTAYLEDRETLPDGTERTDVTDAEGFPVTEPVVDLDPDLVLAASIIGEQSIEALREAGLTVYNLEQEQSLTDVYTGIEVYGQFLNRCDEAETIVDEMRATVEFIDGAVAGEDRPTVYHPQGGGFTAGAGTVEEDLITIAGGENLGTELGVEFYDQVSEEAVVDADPEWILRTEGPTELPESLSSTTAVQEDQIIEVDPDALGQPGPRMIEPLEAIAEALHPEALEQARQDDPADDPQDDPADDPQDDPADDMDDGTNGDDDTADDADDDGAGMTAVAALVALSAVVVATRRRA